MVEAAIPVSRPGEDDQPRDLSRRHLIYGTRPARALIVKHEGTFEKVARHYLAALLRKVRKGKGSIKTYTKARWMLETFIFPKLGDKPIGDITASQLLVELKKIEEKGLNETARRTKQRCGRVFRHGIGLGYPIRDITPDLRGLLEAPQVEHHAGLTDPREVGELLLELDGYLKLQPLVFLRPFELRNLEWEWVDFDEAQLRIPRAHMKGKRTYHLVPLAIQALAILKELHAEPAKTLSSSTITRALRRLGYSGEEMTDHGFRTVASTPPNEDGTWRPDAIERQLSHQEDDEVRGAYDAAEYLGE